eukprot:scaffold391_cov157-Skeletonema_menzelii.AAC.1
MVGDNFVLGGPPDSNLRGVAASISEDYFDLEDYNLEEYEIDSFDGEDAFVFLADPCNTRSTRDCASNRCERVGRTCSQKLDVCSGLSRSECNARDRRQHCQFTQPRGGVARCERIQSCNGFSRDECNAKSPDCRWDQGDCVRKHEGESDGPQGDCSDMTRNQCDRAMHCFRNDRNVCVPNDLTAIE